MNIPSISRGAYSSTFKPPSVSIHGSRTKLRQRDRNDPNGPWKETRWNADRTRRWIERKGKKGGEEILAQSLAILREELRSKSLVRRPALSMAWQIDLTDRFRVTLRYCSRRVSHEKLAISIGVTIVRGESFCFSCSNHALGSFYTILGSFSLLKEVVNGETIDDRSISNHSVRPSWIFSFDLSRLWIIFRTVPLMVKLSMIKVCETVFYFRSRSF